MRNFDYNATTPISDSALNVWVESNGLSWQNPSSSYQSGVRAKAILKKTREEFASLLGVDADLLVFCSGATEACNMWVQSFFSNEYFDGKALLVANQEHSCIRKSALMQAEDRIHWFSPSNGDVVSKIAEHLDMYPEIGAVAMMAANNETGIIYPWRDVAKLCRDRGVVYFCDATQWVGKLATDGFDQLDFFCGSAHKFGGPKGTGFLKVSKRFPFVGGSIGGGQESGLRAGTEDLPSICAMLEALKGSVDFAVNEQEIEKRTKWKNEFVDKLKNKFPNVVCHNDGFESLWNTASLALPERNARDWLEALDKLGFMVSAGSACSSSSQKISPVLQDMGIVKGIAMRTVRFSTGWSIEEKDWEDLFDAIVSIVEQWKSQDKNPNVISIDDL